MNDEDAKDSSDQRWVGLAVGLSIAAAAISFIGILVYFFRRSESAEQRLLASGSQQQELLLALAKQQQQQQQQQQLAAPPAYWTGGRSNGGYLPSRLTPPAILNTPDNSLNAQPVIMHTYALTRLSEPTIPTRLAQATETAYDVTLSVVGPAGSYAAFSMEPGELMNSLTPTGNTIILATCQERKVRLLPHQTIYAKGQGPSPDDIVYATATAHEVGTRIYS